ncbi:unnamed protein product [Tilletia controversa]|uniref:D-xylose 1-dehydrogenase (NADP(+), D-xylono-1,5-lactone-forming) n=3 Tax=Tilletia TaxID=13289 RepID=A0A8X7MN00_9BASI|nr:hypothetical protein CF336_g1891 [Tilletia laevis]KAE8199052.1 hypothetical protein CF328_g3361 [Tilletia controversa]KAE8261829.1 hypothetical protein A4X03_0g2937 [Tilletia caries]KAE8242553.1 hypothetical protein A4X06_0g6855 [Tilletia controversa]CAD6885627.1 unnamed protein product [Tilletia caries]
MSSSSGSRSPYVCRWGILATGGIAKVFSKDLLVDPASRKVDDVSHKVVAVASSSSIDRAKSFIEDAGLTQHAPTAYGTYEDMVQDSNVNIVYVATPHAFHYRDVMLCLNHNKHVLCEKPFTINAKQAERIFSVAKEKKLFVMEAVWTRFFPIISEIQDLVHRKQVLGKIRRVQSDLSCYFAPDPKHRLFAPELGGGALLDLGIYALTWQSLILHRHPENQGRAPRVSSSMIKTSLTKVDETTAILLNFDELGAQGVATCSMTYNLSEPAVTISGEKGDLIIRRDPYRPQTYTLLQKDKDGIYTEARTKEFKIPGNGMFWEADACARALRDKQLEAPQCSHEDTLFTMRVMDQARAQGDLVYPESLEAV